MTEQNRSETLSNEDPNPPRKSRKTLIVAASAVVALLAAGGIGFTLVNRDEPQAKGSQVSQSTPSAESGTPLDPSQDEEAEMGDATTDNSDKKGNPQDGTPQDVPQDGTPQDARPVTGDQNTNTGKKTDEGSAGTGNHTAKPTTPSQQEQPGDNPADGPAGELAGQCAKSGC